MINKNDMHIIIDNLDYDTSVNPITVTHNQSDIIAFVTQYRFQGGPEQPIRYLEMKVNKNDIDSAYPNLADSIVEGKTRVIIDAVDGGTFLVTKIWLTEYEYELVATGLEVTLNTATLSGPVYEGDENNDIYAISQTNLDPPNVVNAIFGRWVATLNLSSIEQFGIYFSSSYASRIGSTSTPSHTINFKKDMPTLVAINMCALMDNAFVFFAMRDGKNTLHYVSYDDIDPLAHNPGSMDGIVNVYPQMTSVNTNYSMFDMMMFQKLTGVSSKDSEGSETIVNRQIVSVSGGYAEAENQYSIDMYGDCTGAQVMSDKIITDDAGAETIAENIVRRYKDPTRSITFTMAEAESDNGGTGWEDSIPVYSYAKKIVDSVNLITLTNEHLCEPSGSSDKIDNFMLRLSTFVRYYPEFKSVYTFGVMKETTLSQELANKLTQSSGTLADIRLSGGTSLAVNGIVEVDDVPSGTTANPPHLVTSKGVYDVLDGITQTLSQGMEDMIAIEDISNRTFTRDTAGDSDVSGYPYAYKIAVTGLTADIRCDMVFGMTDLALVCWSPFCKTDNGNIWIYSNSDRGSTVVVNCGYTLIKEYLNP